MRKLSAMGLSCALDNRELQDLDGRIRVDGITETATERPFSPGAILRRERERLTVTLKIKIKEPNPAENQLLRQAVNGWAAAGGWLTTGLNEGQRLHVQCLGPLTGSALHWENPGELAFVSDGLAYWQDRFTASATGSGAASGSLVLTPSGTRACCLEAEITNTGLSPLTSLQLSANGRTIRFQGLALAAGSALRLGYDDLHRLFAVIGGSHALGSRTGDSADHILLLPRRANTVSYTADQPCAVTCSARGVYE